MEKVNKDNYLDYTFKLDLQVLDQIQPDLVDPTELYATREVITRKFKELSLVTQLYGVTLTLKKMYHDDDDTWMHKYIIDKMNKSRVWKNKNYILIPEYTQQGVLHYHGVIWDMYEVNFMKLAKWWRRTFGYVKPELKIINFNKWIDYITKDYGKIGLWTIYNITDRSNT